IVLIFFSIYSYRITDSFILTTDFGRDLEAMIKIAQGHLTLLGPKLSLGGTYAGPYYYYFFTPALMLSGLNVFSIVYLNSFLFALSLGVIFFILRSFSDLKRSLLLTASLGLLPMFIFGSHYPGNGLSYLPLLLVFL